jgi:hypothetical protein
MHGDGWVFLLIGLLAWYLVRRVRRADRDTREFHRNRDL